ncbi:MAG TPA: PD-(D/E)XK nuclease family protein [Candidatus Binataceae bacterium]
MAAARKWLEAIPAAAEVLVIAPVREAADDLVRELAAARGAVVGIHRVTLNRLVGLLAADWMAAEGLAPAAGLAAQAVAARAVYRLAPTGKLDHFAPVLDRPGFAGALARTLAEIRVNDISADQLRGLGPRGAAIAAVLEQFDAEFRAAKLADRAAMLKAAAAAASEEPPPRFVAIPTLLLDVPVESALEAEFVAALARRAPQILATVPVGDTRTASLLEKALGISARAPAEPQRRDGNDSSLIRLQDHLFSEAPPEREVDKTVAMISAPGEMHECVEIARRIQAEARVGVRFDRIAVLLHDSARYSTYLQEALERAGIPAYFARGTRRPEPGGRALLALLACAAENLSARRFAEYVSLAQVPDDQSPRGDAASAAADTELTAAPLGADLELPAEHPESEPAALDPVPVIDGMLRAPWRWERLLVDAAVIGSAARWERRLGGLESELGLRRAGLLKEDDAHAAALDRRILDLEHLKRVALPIIATLAALPRQAAWGEWVTRLRALVEAAVRDRDPVLAALAELGPMAPVGPVDLDEVRLVLSERLGRLEAPPPRRRYGAVFVAAPNRARGMTFDVVIAPGLAERVFPKKLTEDPILPDAARALLSPHLARQEDRVAAERLSLRMAAGAAGERVMFSYPRVDLDQGRPRVPSFYALELMQAAEGRLRGFDELARRAASEQATRLGWPAPSTIADAIDDAEFDLAVLEKLVDADPETTIGAAHYLLDSNPHLGRALRARARRWLRKWTPADGLVDPEPSAMAALQRHQLSARPYSPTALQNYAQCPYRFFLQAIHRLEPREEIEAIEVLDPLTRGALFAEVQFEILSTLRAGKALPVTRENLAAATQLLDERIEQVAERWHEKLAPAIERVWRDGIEGIRADLHEWLRRAADDRERWRPEAFELAFGLRDREQADPRSSEQAIALDSGLTLRGSIDLVERDPAGHLRVTDHKTGKVRAEKNFVIGGGKTLQPVLYALAAERVLEEPIQSGRLYYCTAAGNYEERVVQIDEGARVAARELAKIVGDALAAGFLPAAPGPRECEWCDYRRICGPYEEDRVAKKNPARLDALKRLREMR